MKTYLRISALVFLLVGVAHTLIITGVIGPFGDVPVGVNWAAAAITYLLFLFGFGLSVAVNRRDQKLQKREEELSSLIGILQDGRKQQLALMELLQTRDLPLEQPVEELLQE